MPCSARSPVIALLSAVVDMQYLRPAFEAACPGIELRFASNLGALDEIDAVATWAPPHGLIARMPRLQLVQSIAAGIDHLTADLTLPRHVPLCRVTDPDLSAGMSAYVAWAVIQHQRQLDLALAEAREGRWREPVVVPPRLHTVGIAGFGTLGRASATVLQALGYAVRGWRRRDEGTPAPAGVTLFHGEAGRAAFLAGCDTVINLLPLTPQTRGVLDARWFAQMRHGAHFVNVGRGDHLVEADLLAALETGQVGAATLDAFSVEPLPSSHPFWRHPRIQVTPHMATRTPAAVVAQQTLANLAAVRAGHAAEVAVDLAQGY